MKHVINIYKHVQCAPSQVYINYAYPTNSECIAYCTIPVLLGPYITSLCKIWLRLAQYILEIMKGISNKFLIKLLEIFGEFVIGLWLDRVTSASDAVFVLNGFCYKIQIYIVFI